MKNLTKKQEEALREFLNAAVVPLIEDVLVKKLGQAMSYAKEQCKEPNRKWASLTDEDILGLWSNDHDRVSFARAIEAALRSKNT